MRTNKEGDKALSPYRFPSGACIGAAKCQCAQMAGAVRPAGRRPSSASAASRWEHAAIAEQQRVNVIVAARAAARTAASDRTRTQAHSAARARPLVRPSTAPARGLLVPQDASAASSASIGSFALRFAQRHSRSFDAKEHGWFSMPTAVANAATTSAADVEDQQGTPK